MVNIPHWPRIPIWQIPRKVDLKPTLRLLEALGNPHHKLPPTIHIAGTNGKGSSLAMLKSIFMEAKYKVHSYTSPHLLEFNERINIAGKHITDHHLHSVLERVRKAASKINLEPSFFEGTTVAAFLAFSESNADILLLETGLGGRLDCTNVISRPILTLITPISYDHMEYLGNKLIQIASEKAGIVKQHTPCVVGPQTEEVKNLLIDKCNNMNSPSFCYERDFSVEKNTDNPEDEFLYLSKKFNIKLPLPSLRGDHQIQNAASVVASIMLLNKKFNINLAQIKNGLINTKWPGRIELLNPKKTKELFGDNIKIYLDGAHNDAGALSLANWIKDNVKGKIYLILGMTRNRNVESFCSLFKGVIRGGAAVNVESEPSSYSASILAKKAKNVRIALDACSSPIEAIKHIKNIHNTSNNETATIIVTGSLFLVSDFLKL